MQCLRAPSSPPPLRTAAGKPTPRARLLLPPWQTSCTRYVAWTPAFLLSPLLLSSSLLFSSLLSSSIPFSSLPSSPRLSTVLRRCRLSVFAALSLRSSFVAYVSYSSNCFRYASTFFLALFRPLRVGHGQGGRRRYGDALRRVGGGHGLEPDRAPVCRRNIRMCAACV